MTEIGPNRRRMKINYLLQEEPTTVTTEQVIPTTQNFLFNPDLPIRTINGEYNYVFTQTLSGPFPRIRTNLRILLAEDSQYCQIITKRILKNVGIECDIVSNGKECIEKVLEESSKYQLILMDIVMPILNGIDACCALKKASINIPIIGLSAVSDERILIEGIEAGMENVISKPLSLDKIDELLKFLKQGNLID